MLREWADSDTHELIDEALTPTGSSMANTWDDDEAWASFKDAMNS